jgi:glyoxylase I family protein
LPVFLEQLRADLARAVPALALPCLECQCGNALIDIVPADKAGPASGTTSSGGANLDHLCLRIDPFDSAAITKHLAEHHVACGLEALRYGAEGEGPSIYLRDPEGNGVELKGPATDQ